MKACVGRKYETTLNKKQKIKQCDLLKWPEGWVERFLFVFGFPFMVALSLTVPDCSRPKYEKYYILTFVMSISWISAISSFMVGRFSMVELFKSRMDATFRAGHGGGGVILHNWSIRQE